MRKIAKSDYFLSCLSVRLLSWMELHETWYLNIFPTSVRKIQASRNSDKKDMWIFMINLLLDFSCNKNVSEKGFRENKKTQFLK